MPALSSRVGLWAAKAAGVASVMYDVVTRPVLLPADVNCSRSVRRSRPSLGCARRGSAPLACATLITPLLTLNPVASAVPLAAESVTAPDELLCVIQAKF